MRGAGKMPRILHVVKVCRALGLHFRKGAFQCCWQRLPVGYSFQGFNTSVAHEKGCRALQQLMAARRGLVYVLSFIFGLGPFFTAAKLLTKSDAGIRIAPAAI